MCLPGGPGEMAACTLSHFKCPTLWDPTDCSPPGSYVYVCWQEYWSGLPYPPPGDLPNPWFKPVSPSSFASDSLLLSHHWSPEIATWIESNMVASGCLGWTWEPSPAFSTLSQEEKTSPCSLLSIMEKEGGGKDTLKSYLCPELFQSPIPTTWQSNYTGCHQHFADKKSGTRRGERTQLWSHSQQMVVQA